MRKKVAFLESSRQDLRKSSAEMQHQVGYDLWRLQQGLLPRDFKSMPSVGKGVFEIRAKEDGRNVGRCFYVAKFEDTIYVLHFFIKKTQKTSPHDIKTGQARFKMLLKEVEK